MSRNENNVIMEGVRIVKRNFAGKEGKFNREGDRNFLVLLDDEVAKRMADDGWNIRFLKPQEDNEDDGTGQACLGVSVKFEGYPPQIYMITSCNRSRLTEDEVDLLDTADIVNVDLIVNPYEWVVNGKSGIKAYLKSMYVTIEEDYLQRKYSDVNDSPSRNGRIDE